MKKTLLAVAMALTTTFIFAQKKTTTSASVTFDATTPADALPKAENNTAVAALDTKEGTVNFEVLIKSFSFTNPKIQEHFNAPNWMDSEKHPKAVFKGKITNLSAVNFSKDGTYTANVEGTLTIHGEAQNVSAPATITVAGKNISTASEFSIKLADYKVDGPAVGAGKVSKEPKISVKADFR